MKARTEGSHLRRIVCELRRDPRPLISYPLSLIPYPFFHPLSLIPHPLSLIPYFSPLGVLAMKVSFVGAGPGSPELLTRKAERAPLRAARICVYAGSLLNPELLAIVPPEAERYDSAGMSLDEIVAVFEEACAAGAGRGPAAQRRAGDLRGHRRADGRLGPAGNRLRGRAGDQRVRGGRGGPAGRADRRRGRRRR